MATRTPTPPASDNFGGDPFQHTTMSFGEHLDELRSSLFKAVLSLAIGFCLGMFFGGSIVNLIQEPLQNALNDHRETESLDRFQKELHARASRGTRPPSACWMIPAPRNWWNEAGMLPDQVYIDPQEILSELKQRTTRRCGTARSPRSRKSAEGLAEGKARGCGRRRGRRATEQVGSGADSYYGVRYWRTNETSSSAPGRPRRS